MMLVGKRLRYIAGNKWGIRRYLAGAYNFNEKSKCRPSETCLKAACNPLSADRQEGYHQQTWRSFRYAFIGF